MLKLREMYIHIYIYLYLKSNINLGNKELFIEIERSVFDTSKDIQIKVVD